MHNGACPWLVTSSGPLSSIQLREIYAKAGFPFPSQNQPFQVLRTLIERADNLVSREDLRQAVWATDTFVDFEHGLNVVMNKIRRALGDSAESPRYIETVSGVGYRFIAVVKAQSASPLDGLPAQEVMPPLAPTHMLANRKVWITLATTAAALTTLIWAAFFRTGHSAISRPVVEFTISAPPGTIFSPPISRQPFAISPDGTRLAFTATGPTGTHVWVRDLASLDMRALPGTEGAWVVFWSPDSRSIYYSVKRILKQADLATGSTRLVATLPFLASFGTWRSKTDLLLYLGPEVVYELSVENGTLRRVSGLDLRLPQFLPASDRILNLFVDPASERYRARVTQFGSGKSTSLMETDSGVQYVPPLRRGKPGTLLYIRAGSLLAQPFDAERLRLRGEPFPIEQNVTYFGQGARACFSASDNGVLVYQTGWPHSELIWYDRAGRVVGTAGRPAPYVGSLRISPDGRQLAAGVWNPDSGTADIWIFGASGQESRRLTYPPAGHSRPTWSPEGRLMAFSSSRIGAPRLESLASTGGSQGQPLVAPASREQVARLNQIQMPTDWSRDGRFIAFDTGLGEEEQEVWLADRAEGSVEPLLRGEYAQWGGVFSPDSRHIAFVSTESGRPEVYVQAFDPMPSPHLVGARMQVLRDGAWIARWRPDGRELFYLGINNWLTALPIQAPFQFGEPKPLYRIPGTSQYGTTSDFQFDVTRDGQRFIMSTTGSASAAPFTVIQNWQEKFDR